MDEPQAVPSSRGVSATVWVVAALLISVVVYAALVHGGREPVRTGLLPDGATPRSLLDERVLDQTGRELRTHDLLDDFLVVDFIFTNCPATCPPLGQAMLRLQEALAGADDVRLASFTVDPRRDSVEQLAAYAERLGADPTRWSFLFTNEALVHRIAFEGLGMGHSTSVMAHSNDFALIDRSGRLRGVYHPLSDTDWLQVLLADLERLRAEPEPLR